jgi:phage terminase large subunit-like protein
LGKSELAAAVALLLTCGDGEERGEVYGCAADRQQASIVFEVAADMVRMCPALNKRVKILASQKRIVYQSTNSFYQVLSAEAYSKHGFNIHGVVFDELHTQPNRKLFDVMTKGSGDARTQPLYFLITTAGTDTNSICYETHQKAKDIIEGRKIDPTFYPVIYGAEETDDWTDPKVWKKANPSLGITVSIDKVQAACDSAKQNPGEENAFRQLRLNQWVKQAVRWMPMDKWDACNFHVNEDDLEGRVCYGGLDLSSTTDITAFVLVFPPMDEDDKFAILPYFWIPEDTLELRVRRDHVPYDIWERQGFLQTTLYNENSDIVDEIVSKYSLPSVNENSIASFVKLRNNKTHSGTVEWGESAKIYTPLFAIVYASFFKYIKLPDEVIKSTLLQIF